MAKLNIQEVETPTQRGKRREKAEVDAHNALQYDARSRLRVGKTKAMIFRCTEEKRAQILRLADALSAGKQKPVSIAETIEMAIDALEQKLKGGQ